MWSLKLSATGLMRFSRQVITRSRSIPKWKFLAGVHGANGLGLSLSGNNLNNQIIGTSGGDSLIGGLGNDTMVGGLGNDVYRVEEIGDVVVENANGGNDTILSTVSFTLMEGLEVETLEAASRWGSQSPTGGTFLMPFPGPNGTTVWLPVPVPPPLPGAPGLMAVPIALTGNSFANSILGTEAADTLDGGAGVDRLVGYGGNDFYYVDNALDTVIEASNGGRDIIFTTSSFTLSADSEVEVLAHALNSPHEPLYLAGNELANQVLGGSGGDGLYGFGGHDTLYGFSGQDLVVGGLGQDYLFGGDGHDTLIGGNGADWLIGGAGADVFKFTGAGDSVVLARDVITDFETGVDKLDFTGFTTAFGSPISGPFTFGTLAPGSGPRIEIGTDISNGFSRILADADGDGIADFEVLVATANAAALPVVGDFII
ncbi:MAG: calcium-binding protein [Hyphomonadaceae bacterium]|nr:calcium-binding protein [Hyphomonadaceae bacterium]